MWPFDRKKKQEEQKRKDALAGKTTTGFLSPGERQRLFRERPQPRRKTR